ncbi:hypothetical protein T492DRAFT_902580 [Pavlovales sp. CCMP2436]|nr:hypothetical protein T492DRAFT_902580 [Pavlovales sp. CCMP2436]
MFEVGESVLCQHGGQLYDAKVLEAKSSGSAYRVHFTGWNKSRDEDVEVGRLLKRSPKNLALKESAAKPKESAAEPKESTAKPKESAAKGAAGKRPAPAIVDPDSDDDAFVDVPLAARLSSKGKAKGQEVEEAKPSTKNAKSEMFEVGESVLCQHGGQLYDAKVLEAKSSGSAYRVHFTGWNKSRDEDVEVGRLLKRSPKNLALKESAAKPKESAAEPKESTAKPKESAAKGAAGKRPASAIVDPDSDDDAFVDVPLAARLSSKGKAKGQEVEEAKPSTKNAKNTKGPKGAKEVDTTKGGIRAYFPKSTQGDTAGSRSQVKAESPSSSAPGSQQARGSGSQQQRGSQQQQRSGSQGGSQGGSQQTGVARKRRALADSSDSEGEVKLCDIAKGMKKARTHLRTATVGYRDNVPAGVDYWASNFGDKSKESRAVCRPLLRAKAIENGTSMRPSWAGSARRCTRRQRTSSTGPKWRGRRRPSPFFHATTAARTRGRGRGMERRGRSDGGRCAWRRRRPPAQPGRTG